jgi:hypothetical protein
MHALPDSVDVFLVGGQSNAEGTGDPSEAATVPEGAGFEFRPESGAFVHLAEPVGRGEGGSAWSAFGATYHAATGRPVVVVSTAVGGAAQHADADGGPGHWDDGGELRPAAIEGLRDCLAALEDRGVEYAFRGVLWHQGESEGMQIDAGAVTVEQYEAAFWRMLERFREAFAAPDLDLFLFQIGRHTEEDGPGWAAVRDAQERFATADEHVHLVFEDAVDYVESGNMQDVVHYDQAGYDRMGREGARAVAAIVDGDTPQT